VIILLEGLLPLQVVHQAQAEVRALQLQAEQILVVQQEQEARLEQVEQLSPEAWSRSLVQEQTMSYKSQETIQLKLQMQLEARAVMLQMELSEVPAVLQRLAAQVEQVEHLGQVEQHTQVGSWEQMVLLQEVQEPFKVFHTLQVL
jgi:hypothetical protein